MIMNRVRYLLFVGAMFVGMAAWGQNSVTEREYWFDYDVANAKTLAQNGDRIDVSALSPGAHTFSMRVKDSGGLWSNAITQFFVIPFTEDDIVSGKNITEQMFWFDYDIANAKTLNKNVDRIDVSALSPGAHTFTLYVKDSGGLWSSAVTQFFVLPRAEDLVIDQASIVRYMYWFDNDVTNYLVADADGATGIIPVDVSGLTTGAHTIYWRVGDSKGAWSDRIYSSLFRYTMPDAGMGTFSNNAPLMLPSGLMAQYTTTEMTQTSGGRLYVKATDLGGSVLPAETGVLLKGESGKTFTLVATAETGPTINDNTLVAITEATTVMPSDGESTNFAFDDGSFYKIDDTEGVQIAAHQAYLQLSTSLVSNYDLGSGITTIWVYDIATGIDEVLHQDKVQVTSEEWYTIDGRKLSGKPMKKGIYIINGRKLVVK